MKRNTLIILAVVLGVGFLAFALMRSSTLPTTSTVAPTSTVASIFQFATKAIDATEKALPHFMQDQDTSLTAADDSKLDSIFGSGNAFTND